MSNIRNAVPADLNRIAEIEVFNYRLNFYPIFRDDQFYFEEFQVANRSDFYHGNLNQLWVYDDGVVKGFVQTDGTKIKKLFVEPVVQGHGIGASLLAFAVALGADHLWALEKNTRAITFYERNGFHKTNTKIPEEDTTEYLIRMERYHAGKE